MLSTRIDCTKKLEEPVQVEYKPQIKNSVCLLTSRRMAYGRYETYAK